ncbi:hypothetical protein [Streptomyces atacamensis]|uniref:hypothetical protein n=1 Tax=Streptomyces atacamensis TaxID=531966 RepID=UPI00399D02AC
MNTDRQAAEARRNAAYRAIEELERAEVRARRAAELDPSPENVAAVEQARHALRAGRLETDRAEIAYRRAVEAGGRVPAAS